jgi:hypothetical protein
MSESRNENDDQPLDSPVLWQRNPVNCPYSPGIADWFARADRDLSMMVIESPLTFTRIRIVPEFAPHILHGETISRRNS